MSFTKEKRLELFEIYRNLTFLKTPFLLFQKLKKDTFLG